MMAVKKFLKMKIEYIKINKKIQKKISKSKRMINNKLIKI